MFSALNSMENTRDFNAGLHTVTLLSFGETEPRQIAKDNGDVVDIKGTIWLKMLDDKGAVDKHSFFYNTETRTTADGTVVVVMTEQDSDNFMRMKNNILKQIEKDHPDVAEQTTVAGFFQQLKTQRAKFQTIVTEVPNAEGTRMWKNFSYNPEEIALVK